MSGSRNWEWERDTELSSGLSRTVGHDLPTIFQPYSRREDHSDDRSANRDAGPPLGVKLTVYRLLNMTAMISFVIAEDILTTKGQVAVPTTLDWISGGLLGVVLYWIGLHEQRKAKKWEWFFEFDLAPALSYGIMCVIGTVLMAPFGFHRLSLAFLVSVSMSSWSLCLLHRLEMSSLGAYLGAVFGTIVSLFFLGVEALTRRVRVRVWARRRAMHFLDNYSPGAPLVEEYEWFGTVGMIAGFLCMIAIFELPIVVVWYLFQL